MKTIVSALAGALLALVFLVAPAAAQATTVDTASIFGAWKPYISEILIAVATGVLGWVLKLIKDKTGLDIEAKHREALQAAITNAAGLVLSKAGPSLLPTIDVRNPIIADGVNYVLKGAPDALKYFGLTPERLREMIVARAGVVGSGNG